MTTFTGKKDVTDDAIVPVNISTSNTLTGFTSEDYVNFDFMITSSQKARYSNEGLRVGNDLIVNIRNSVTDKITSVSTIKGVYASDGLEFIGSTTYVDDVGYLANIKQILKNTSSSAQATAENDDFNWDGCLAFGTSGNDTLYGAKRAYNSLHDSDGDDTVYGGDAGNYFAVGKGNDTLVGGFEDDEFDFRNVFSFATKTKNNYEKAYVKTIENFNAGQGDQIELSYIGYNHLMRFTTERNLATWKRGDVIFKVEGNDGWIYGNLDKDKDAEIQIKLLGVTVFVEGSIDLTL
jgi:Ca2+-binding RTX toxin-like protein